MFTATMYVQGISVSVPRVKEFQLKPIKDIKIHKHQDILSFCLSKNDDLAISSPPVDSLTTGWSL